MEKTKRDMIEYAKWLYIMYNSEGKKLHSLRDIAEKIKQKFNKSVNYSTVLNWAKKYDWNKLNEKIKQQSIEKATEEKFTKEEQLIDAESDKLAKDYKNAENLANIGFSVALNAYKKKEAHSQIDFRDAMAAIRLGTDIKFRIQDMPESKPESKIKQVFKIGNQEIEF